MIKGLFKIIFALLILAILSPLVILGLMYQGNADEMIPLETYSDEATMETILTTELDDAITALGDPEADINYALSADTLNAIIYTYLTGESSPNPAYRPAVDCEGADCAFYTETFSLTDEATGTLRLTGAWVEFTDGQGTLNLNASMQYNDGFTYATQLSLTFNIADQADAYYVAFDRVSIGRLPLTQNLFNRVLNLLERVTGEALVSDQNFELGTLNVEDLSFTVQKADLVEQLKNDPDRANGIFLGELLEIVFANQWVSFDFTDEAIDFNVQSSTLFNTTEYALPDAVALVYDAPADFVAADELSGLLESFVLTQALTGDSVINLSETVLNQLVAQSLSNSDPLSFSRSFERADGDPITLSMILEHVYIDVSDTGAELYLTFAINDGVSVIALSLTEATTSQPGTLAFAVDSITVGQDADESESDYLFIENTASILASLSDTVSNDVLRINESGEIELQTSFLTAAFDASLAGSGVALSDINLVEDAIALSLVLDTTLASVIGDYGDALKTYLADDLALIGIEDSMSEFDSTEVENLMTTIRTLNEELSSDRLNDETATQFVEQYEALNTAEQDALTTSLESLIGSELTDSFEAIVPD